MNASNEPKRWRVETQISKDKRKPRLFTYEATLTLAHSCTYILKSLDVRPNYAPTPTLWALRPLLRRLQRYGSQGAGAAPAAPSTRRHIVLGLRDARGGRERKGIKPK